MKEAIGGTWLFQIVIVFILMFAGYMCLSINHSKAFSIKSEIVESLSRHGGVDQEEIRDILSKASYRTRGSCERLNSKEKLDCKGNDQSNCWVGYTRDGGHAEGNNATFCIRKVDVSSGSYELPPMYYYQVRVFYQLDLPIFNSIFSFNVKGDTTLLYHSDVKGADN